MPARIRPIQHARRDGWLPFTVRTDVDREVTQVGPWISPHKSASRLESDQNRSVKPCAFMGSNLPEADFGTTAQIQVRDSRRPPGGPEEEAYTRSEVIHYGR